jgi:hypothetical protein
MEHIFFSTVNDGVAGVVAALAADDDVGIAGQDVDDLAFAFIAPLRADEDGVCHETQRSTFHAEPSTPDVVVSRTVRNGLQPSAETRYLPDMRTILLIVLILLLIGAFPSWPYSTGWGYYPSGGIGLVLLIVLILALVGRI